MPTEPTVAPVSIPAREVEPNGDFFSSTVIQLPALVQGKISGGSDADYFKFATPFPYRDFVKIQIQNPSPTLGLRLDLYDGLGSGVTLKSGYGYATANRGFNLDASFAAEPNSVYYIKISSGAGEGNYVLSIVPLGAYDAYESNDDVFHAAPIQINQPINAGIMDGKDKDYYKIVTSSQVSTVTVLVQNPSPTLGLRLDLYDGLGSGVTLKSGYSYATANHGFNLDASFAAKPNSVYYIKISSGAGEGGYTLTVKQE
jgi:hypothetical protein